MGLVVAPEAEVGPERFVTYVADEGFDMAEQLLMSFQVFVAAEKLSTLLTRPNPRFLGSGAQVILG